MNLFEAVKDAVPTRTAAEHYGIEVKRNGMACCPFHDDRTPSMKVDKRFHCFGCQEDGDVIDFVGKLFDLSPKRAAEKLAEDFGVRYEGLQAWQPQRRPSVISKLAAAQEYRKKENRCYRVLCEYCHLLRDWKERYAPKPEDEDWHPHERGGGFSERSAFAGVWRCGNIVIKWAVIGLGGCPLNWKLLNTQITVFLMVLPQL